MVAILLLLPKHAYGQDLGGCRDMTIEVDKEVNRISFLATNCVAVEKTTVTIYSDRGEALFELELRGYWNKEGSIVIVNPGSYEARLFTSEFIRDVIDDEEQDSGRYSSPEEVLSRSFSIDEPEPDSSGTDQGAIVDASVVLCGENNDEECVVTALGEIPFNDTVRIAGYLAQVGVALGGLLALILIAIASYRISTSQGDPRKLEGARELVAGAIFGLLMVIFSAFILRTLGVQILGLF